MNNFPGCDARRYKTQMRLWALASCPHNGGGVRSLLIFSEENLEATFSWEFSFDSAQTRLGWTWYHAGSVLVQTRPGLVKAVGGFSQSMWETTEAERSQAERRWPCDANQAVSFHSVFWEKLPAERRLTERRGWRRVWGSLWQQGHHPRDTHWFIIWTQPDGSGFMRISALVSTTTRR